MHVSHVAPAASRPTATTLSSSILPPRVRSSGSMLTRTPVDSLPQLAALAVEDDTGKLVTALTTVELGEDTAAIGFVLSRSLFKTRAVEEELLLEIKALLCPELDEAPPAPDTSALPRRGLALLPRCARKEAD